MNGEVITVEAAEAVEPSLKKHPEASTIALFFATMEDNSLSVECQVEKGGEINPRDVGHVVAFYIQHNFLELIPQAALWIAAVAKQRKKDGGDSGAPEIANVLPVIPGAAANDADDTPRIIDSVPQRPILVDAQGNAQVQH